MPNNCKLLSEELMKCFSFEIGAFFLKDLAHGFPLFVIFAYSLFDSKYFLIINCSNNKISCFIVKRLHLIVISSSFR